MMGFHQSKLHDLLDPNLLSILNSDQKPGYTDPKNISKHFLYSDHPNYEYYRRAVFYQHKLGWPGFTRLEDATWYLKRMPLTHNLYRFVDPETFDPVGYVVGILDPTGKAYHIPAPSGHDEPGFL
jgi:hypothetical protein